MSYGLSLSLLAGVVTIIYALFSIKWILNQPVGNSRMQEIASAIQDGASAYLARQYRTIAIVGIIILT